VQLQVLARLLRCNKLYSFIPLCFFSGKLFQGPGVINNKVLEIMKQSKKKSIDDVTIVECGPRECSFLEEPVSSLDKVRFIKCLAKTGLKKIDYAAFLHPRLYPGCSDTEMVTEALEKKNNLVYAALVTNEIGCRRAVNTTVDEIVVLIAATEAFSRINTGLGLRETLNKMLPTIFEAAVVSGKAIRMKILTAFGCPYSGRVSCEDICDLVSRLAKMGASEVCLVDNTGLSNPIQVRETVEVLMDMNLGTSLAAHFHNHRGTALANCVAAYEAGIRVFDTAVGGLSGTPFGAPRVDFVTCNAPTEDVVHLFEEMNIKTGVDLDLLLECVKIAEELNRHKLNGHILRTGPGSKLVGVP
jgi:hydroxymethylglutaryl-CoA lyase